MTKTAQLESVKKMGDLDKNQRMVLTFEVIKDTLSEMGIRNVTLDAMIVAPPFYDGATLIKDKSSFITFIEQFSLRVGCLGYAFNDVVFLTVKQFCELYIGDSYPEIPTTPLSVDQYYFRGKGGLGSSSGKEAQEFPICFVLGCPRSGTTLFRTMLNVHDRVWAPGELTLAHFENMAERAIKVLPLLRYSIIPEIASRLENSITSFSTTFRQWENEGLSIAEVYKKLYRAAPDTLIVDKSPAYSIRYQNLEAIGRQFTNAKFIHLIRNPHDVIRSFVQLQMHKNVARFFEPGLNPYQMGEIFWYVHNANIIRFLDHIPAERKCILRYEDLVSSPKHSLTSACTLLNLSLDHNMADPYLNNTKGKVALGASDVHINYYQKVESRTPGKAFYALGSECQNLAKEYGYSMPRAEGNQ